MSPDRFKTFLEAIGELHDAHVTRLAFDLEERRVTIDIDDFYRNFAGLPEYKGDRFGAIIFRGVEDCKITVQIQERNLRIDGITVSAGIGSQKVAILKFWPSGSMSFNYESVSFPNVE